MPSPPSRNSAVAIPRSPTSSPIRRACSWSADRSLGGDIRRGRFLDHLLGAALEGAVAVAERDGSLAVPRDLDLDVAGVDEFALQVDGGAGARRLALPARRPDALDQIRFALRRGAIPGRRPPRPA